MPKFFIEQTQLRSEHGGKRLIDFYGEDAHHLARVLRMKPGDALTAADGQGRLYHLEITALAADTVSALVLGEEVDYSEPTVRITLYQSILKGEKMDWVLQKGTEIGISAFVPYLSTRTVARPEPKGYRKKQERWQKIVTAAAKQSERGLIPVVRPITPWTELAELLAGHLTIVAWEGEQTLSLRAALAEQASTGPPAELSLIIGPEGGLAAAEVEQLVAWGAVPVSLGPRILRAETAGPVAAALVLYHFGDLDPVPRVEEG
ncbi:MAG: 16S rRNA (uracil(1498)-N(3))-methyltransferase [Firmicutes bacterium]|nr:16S rRNA (uracil(1498)-N(3))-methyltransferase [Bacillota bacterium]